MTNDQVWEAIGAPDDPGALLPRTLDDLVERGLVEVRHYRATPYRYPKDHYSLTASEPAV